MSDAPASLSPLMRRVLIVGVVVVCLGVLLYALQGAIVGLVLALIIAYLLDPVIDRMEERGMSRSGAILILLSGSALVGALVLALVVPMVAKEVAVLAERVDGYLHDAQTKAVDVVAWLNAKMGTDISLDGSFLDSVKPYLKDVDPSALNPVGTVLWALGSSTVGVVLALANFVLVPVYAFYFLRDFDKGKAWALELVPVTWRARVGETFGEIDRLMGRFIRGQLTICAALAVLYSLGLVFLADIDLAVLVGVTSGLLFIVPYLGTIFGAVAATVLCLMRWGVDIHLLGVIATFGGAQLIEGTLLTPRILGDSTGLHPVAVILSLIIGASLFGLMGMLLAVPTAAALKVVLDQVEARYRKSSFYLGDSVTELDESADDPVV